MTFGGTSFTNFAGVMSRTLRGSRVSDEITDADIDALERTPALRADIEAMLADAVDGTPEAAPEVIKLRESEKEEHDEMSAIRFALYPID